MEIKIQCGCGARFSFEIEPVDGRMPTSVNCPQCNASAVELANAEIAKQLGVVPVPTSPPRLRVSTPKAASQPSPAAPEAAAAEAMDAVCSRHPGGEIVSSCHVCGKPICLKCLEQFGYVCSYACRERAETEGIDVPVYAEQRSVKEHRANVAVKRIAFATAALIVAALGFWIWYGWFARNPKVVYSLSIPKLESRYATRPFECYRLIAPGELLWIKDKKVTFFDVVKKTEIWSVPFVVDSEDTYLSDPHLVATRDAFWVWFPNWLARFDRQTGGMTAPVTNQIVSVVGSEKESMAVVVSKEPSGRKVLTRIQFSDGSTQIEELSPAPTQAEVKTPTRGKPASAFAALAKAAPQGRSHSLAQSTNKTAASVLANLLGEENDWAFRESARQYQLAGANVAQFQTELLEEKMITHPAPAAPKPKKLLVDSSDLTVGQSMKAAAEMAPPPEVEQVEDLSRYRVILRRRLGENIPEWTSEVIGSPSFFPLKTVDLVAAGTTLYVLDKNNKKLWEAKSTYPMGSRDFYDERQPCLETKDALYVADLGNLTRYDPANGSVLWHLESVGVSQIQEDSRGALYVSTTTASPGILKPDKIRQDFSSVILKVDSKTGKVLWRSQRPGDRCILSGKFVYATRASQRIELLNLEEGSKSAFNLDLIDPSTGKLIWTYGRHNCNLLHAEAHDNWILVHADDKVVVMNFFSL